MAKLRLDWQRQHNNELCPCRTALEAALERARRRAALQAAEDEEARQ